MSQTDLKFIKPIGAGTPTDAEIASGDTLQEALYKAQGQLDPVKARLDVLELSVQGGALIDLTGVTTDYYVSPEDSKKSVLCFVGTQDGVNIYLHDDPANPVIYWVINCPDQELPGNPTANFISGSPSNITVLPGGRWIQLAYGFTFGTLQMRVSRLQGGTYGDINVDGDTGLIWTVIEEAITYTKLAQALRDIIDGKIDSSLIGAANGVAPLNAASQIDESYLPAGVVGGMEFKGAWNAATGIITSSDPALNGVDLSTLTPSAANNGWYFITMTAGNVYIGGMTEWNVGDWVVSHGTGWIRVDNTDAVVSVNGAIGAVSLGTANIPENIGYLYFTVQRAIDSITNATHGTMTAAATGKAVPVDADLVGVMDSADSFTQKKTTWAQVKSTLQQYFVTLFLALPPSNGIAVRTSTTTSESRSIVGTANQIDVANGSGVAGNPALSIPAVFVAPGSVKVTTTLDVGVTGSSFPGWIAQFTDNANTYSQISHQNKSAGASASSDIVCTADTGTDTTNFIDLGINSSGYAVGSWTVSGALDGYLYTASSHLSIGTAAAKDLIFHTGGTLAANTRLRIMSTGEWRLNNGGAGASGHVLTCKGANTPPVWQYPTLATTVLPTINTQYNVTSTAYAVVNAAVRLSGLAAGKYLVTCTMEVYLNNNDTELFAALFAGTSGSTTILSESESATVTRRNTALDYNTDYRIPITLVGIATITAGQVIEPKIKSANGQISVVRSGMTAVRIG